MSEPAKRQLAVALHYDRTGAPRVVAKGKGTLGALLVDPTVYEDIKSAVGNVERNEVLRALVRYSIKADEKRPAAEAHP